MKSNFSKLPTYICLPMLIAVFMSCTKYDNVIPKPEIMIYQQDSWNEYLSGHVLGVDSKLYNLAIYANINDSWYNLPDAISPLTSISEDGVWTCYVEIGSQDLISRLSIYLLPTGYFPPILDGERMVPLKINLVAAAKKTITFERN